MAAAIRMREVLGMTIRLPFPPSVNTYWRHAQGRTYLSKQGRRFRLESEAAVLAGLGLPEPITGRVRVAIELTMPDRRKRDIDNHGGKAVLDALVHAGVIEDDEQVDELIVRRLSVEPPGCCDVTIEEVAK